jgi:DNA-binding PadR family transcriptional regulator
MSLPNILLSLLRVPMSGSELIRLFRGTINHFWTTDLSQIYRALDDLERQGCVRKRSVPSRNGPARKVYRLTAKGGKRLDTWIREEPSVPGAKFEYLAQLFSVTATEAPRERARELLDALLKEAAEHLAILESIEARMLELAGPPDKMPAHLFYPWLTLRHGLRRRRGLVEWIDEALEHLARRTEADDVSGEDAAREIEELLRMTAEMTGKLAAEAGAGKERQEGRP